MPRSQQEEEKIVCASCGLANYPLAHYCVECGGPLDAHAVNDAFDTIKTQGWAYLKAQESPRNLIVVVGVWMLFLPLACGTGFLLLSGFVLLLQGEVPRDAAQRFLLLLAGAALGVAFWVSATIIRRTTTGFMQDLHRRAEAGDAEDEDDEDDDGGRFDDDEEDEDE